MGGRTKSGEQFELKARRLEIKLKWEEYFWGKG
jgi:hypothetical protein